MARRPKKTRPKPKINLEAPVVEHGNYPSTSLDERFQKMREILEDGTGKIYLNTLTKQVGFTEVLRTTWVLAK